MQNRTSTPARISNIAAEPYRIFFPLAILFGMAGVLLWPAHYAGWLKTYPLQLHARMMIEGFVGGFAIGFLTTALPKMLSSKPLSPANLYCLIAPYLVANLALIFEKQALGDASFAVTLILFISLIVARVLKHKQLPPPAMALAGMGMLSGIVGSLYWAFFPHLGMLTSALFFQKLLYQAFILLPILGIGTFLFPKIYGQDKAIPRGRIWKLKMLESLGVGLLILYTYWLESRGPIATMSWVRFLICTVWLSKECGWFIPKRSTGFVPTALQFGLILLLISLVVTAILPGHTIALEHILYIGGFGLITLLVATRVIFGHSGQAKEFHSWNKWLIASVALLILAMATRVSADFMPDSRQNHHIYAAVCWVVVCIIWGVAVIPYVWKTPPKKINILSSQKTPEIPSIFDMNFRK